MHISLYLIQRGACILVKRVKSMFELRINYSSRIRGERGITNCKELHDVLACFLSGLPAREKSQTQIPVTIHIFILLHWLHTVATYIWFSILGNMGKCNFSCWRMVLSKAYSTAESQQFLVHLPCIVYFLKNKVGGIIKNHILVLRWVVISLRKTRVDLSGYVNDFAFGEMVFRKLDFHELKLNMAI